MNIVSGLNNSKDYRYVIFSIISSAYVLVYFHRMCPAVIAVDMQEFFKISGSVLGLLSSAYFYPYAVMQLPAGMLVDSWGPRKTVSLFFILAALGSIMMGLAPNMSLAFFGRMLIGIGVSTVFVSNFKLLAEWFAPHEFAVMGGIFMAMGGVGVLFSAAPLGFLSNIIGWRMTLTLIGGISLLMSALVYAFVFNRPEDKGWPSTVPPQKKQIEKKISLSAGLKMVLAEKDFWPVAIWSFFTIGIFFALAGLWGGPYLIQVYGLSKTASGAILSMSAVALIFGSPLLGFLSNHVGRKPVLIGCSLMLISVCAVFYAFTDRLPHIMLYLLFFCLCLSSSASAPVIVTATKELFPIPIAGTSVAIVNLFPFIGGPFFQIILGAILSRAGQEGDAYSAAGYQNMFLACLIGAFISLLLTVFLKETLSRE
ncbi:MAG: MFS transporter [Desulfobacteraceae bacterium]|nr:MAG: MFS transporter [Desulfobacteraceae bacterium]